jgi:hypothetical protein
MSTLEIIGRILLAPVLISGVALAATLLWVIWVGVREGDLDAIMCFVAMCGIGGLLCLGIAQEQRKAQSVKKIEAEK